MKTIKITAHNKISIIDVDFGDYKAMQKAVGGMLRPWQQSRCTISLNAR